MGHPDKVIYLTSAKTVGGCNGTATITDREGTLTLAAPGAADTEAFNPEQLFAVGYAACFEFGGPRLGKAPQVASLKSAPVTADVSLIARSIGGYGLKIALSIDIEGLSEQDAETVVREVHEGICPYSNAVCGNVDVGLKVTTRA